MIKKIDTKVLAKQLKEAADYLADNKETGDFYDTEICLYPDTNFEKVADDIVTEFNYVLSSWKSWAHG